MKREVGGGGGVVVVVGLGLGVFSTAHIDIVDIAGTIWRLWHLPKNERAKIEDFYETL